LINTQALRANIKNGIVAMKDNLNQNNEDEQYLLEEIKTLGFKLSGVRTFDEIPYHKSACLLITQDEKLRRNIMGCASQNDFVVLFNPTQFERKQCEKIFAFIMGKSEKEDFPYPEFLTDKYIDNRLSVELINDFLLSLK
jgi:hypothetical protein